MKKDETVNKLVSDILEYEVNRQAFQAFGPQFAKAFIAKCSLWRRFRHWCYLEFDVELAAAKKVAKDGD